VTKSKISRTICAVAKWRDTAQLFHTTNNIKKAQEMLEEIEKIVDGLGEKREKRVATKG